MIFSVKMASRKMRFLTLRCAHGRDLGEDDAGDRAEEQRDEQLCKYEIKLLRSGLHLHGRAQEDVGEGSRVCVEQRHRSRWALSTRINIIIIIIVLIAD